MTSSQSTSEAELTLSTPDENGGSADFDADSALGGIVDAQMGGGVDDDDTPEVSGDRELDESDDPTGDQAASDLAQGIEPKEPEKAKLPATKPNADFARPAQTKPEAKPEAAKPRGVTREQLADLVAKDIEAAAARGPFGQQQHQQQFNPAAPENPAPTGTQNPAQPASAPAQSGPLLLDDKAVKALEAEYGEPIKPLLSSYNQMASAFEQMRAQTDAVVGIVRALADDRLIADEAELNDALDQIRGDGFEDVYGKSNEDMTPAQQRNAQLLMQYVGTLRNQMRGSRQKVSVSDLVHASNAGIHRDRIAKRAAEKERLKLQSQVKRSHQRMDVVPGGGGGRPSARGLNPTQELERFVSSKMTA